MVKSWRDTHMPAAGAEHYVVAQLMFRDIDAFKCERGRAGTDVVAADSKYGTSVSIQVKSRWTRKATGFPIKEPKADFVVFVRLNLDLEEGKPDCYVFPAAVVRRAIEVGPGGAWHKVHLRKIQNFSTYKDNWGSIATALRLRTRGMPVRRKRAAASKTR